MDISNDQLRIARHFLLSSPPGQFDHTLRDLHELLSSALTPEWSEEIQKEYNSRSGREALQLDPNAASEIENEELEGLKVSTS